jgi:hypothetical protein
MFTRPVTRRLALVGLELAFFGMLGWVVLSSTSSDRSVRADIAGSQSKNKAQKAEKRWAPTEGVPEAAKPASAQLVPSIGTSQACTTFDFGGGATQGFTTEAVFGTPLILWHGANAVCRAFLTGHTTPYTFYYGQDGTCNYNTGARNASNLISPAISLVGKFAPFSVNFNYLLFVEGGGFDTTFVDISTNNGATWTQFLSKANLINDNQWHNVSANISALVGAATSVRLRFRFDSIDNIANSTTGWHVDDISVCGEAFNFCLQSDSGDNILRFNSITGQYDFTQCSTGFTRSGIGTVTANGCNVSLQDNTGDHFVSASVDNCAHTGSATLTYKVSPLRLQTFSIKDTNTLNNTCTCP